MAPLSAPSLKDLSEHPSLQESLHTLCPHLPHSLWLMGWVRSDG